MGQIRNFLPTDENVNLLREVQMIETSGVGAGVKAQPQRFWFIENPGEILENTGKIPENSDTNVSTPSNKTEWNTFENDFFLQNFAPDEKRWRPFFGFHGMFVAQKCFGKFGKICVKFLCPPKNLLAPTPILKTDHRISCQEMLFTFAFHKCIACSVLRQLCFFCYLLSLLSISVGRLLQLIRNFESNCFKQIVMLLKV